MAGLEELLIRDGCAEDAETVLRFIRELAEYEKEAHQVRMTVEQLREDGWPTEQERAEGRAPRFEVLMAERPAGSPVGFAIFFYNYSTWEGMGLYLEDLYIQPESRGGGVGKSLILAVAQRAQERRCARFQWQAIDFNESAIKFYERLGARERVETGDARWLNFIMDKEALDAFTTRTPTH